MTRELTHLSLFSGIGGIDLVAEWAGFRNVCFVEIDKFCQKVLRKHWPDVPIVEDVHDVTKEKVMAYAESYLWGASRDAGCLASDWGNSRSSGQHRGTRSPITLITGGFPCQRVSVAGKRRGKEDDRWLWPEMLRVIREIRPTWVVAENVAGLAGLDFSDSVLDLEGEALEATDFDEAILNAILDGIIADLEEIGYEVLPPFLIPACAVNAPHRRDRIFIVAYCSGNGSEAGFTNSERWQEGNSREFIHGSEDVADTETRTIRPRLCKSKQAGEWRRRPDNDNSQDVADTDAILPRYGNNGNGKTFWTTKDEGQARGRISDGAQWAVEPDVGRVAHGVPRRVDRLRALGNAVVPQQIYPILKAIAEIECHNH